MSDIDKTQKVPVVDQPAGPPKDRGEKSRPSREPHRMVEPTPIFISHRMRVIILIGLTLALGFLIRSVPGIISTVLLGATLALILSFPVRLLQRKLSRKISILIVTITLLGGTVTILVLVIPILIAEITQFVVALPSIIDTTVRITRDLLGEMHQRGWVRQQPDEVIQDIRSGLLDTAQSLLGAGLNNVVKTLSTSLNVFITVFGMVFVAIYLLADIPKFHESYLRLWAPRYRPDAKVLWDTMGFSLSRYLSAQVLSLTIQGLMAFAGLMFLGVPYALVLGLVQAITAILPYIGAWIAAIPAVLVALTISWETAVGVGILYLALNQIEGNLITPNLQGNAVKVHPILIFMGVIGGGQLFGMMGAILAVPTIALVRVIFEFFWLRLRVPEDKPTLLAIMRNDTAAERVQSGTTIAAEIQEDGDTTYVPVE